MKERLDKNERFIAEVSQVSMVLARIDILKLKAEFGENMENIRSKVEIWAAACEKVAQQSFL